MSVERGRPASGPLRNRSRATVFLAYHSISEAGPPILSVTPELFERQLSWLRRRGYQAGGHEDLASIAAGRPPEGRRVFLTFDDGYRDNLTEALPRLQAHRFKALAFILPPAVDDGGSLNWPEVADRHSHHPDVMRSLTWPMVETMAEGGVEFGSHSLSHPHLTELGDEELKQELSDSRARIAERLGSCSSLAYPFGDWDGRVARAAAATGYSFAFTLPFGHQRSASPLSIPRIPIDQRDSGARFALKLTPTGRRLLLSPAKARLRRLRGLAALPRRASVPAKDGTR